MAALFALRTLQCYTPSMQTRITRLFYSKADKSESTSGLLARQFGTLQLLSAIVQINAGLSIHHAGSYNTALWSHVLILVHFVWERVGERTVSNRSLLSVEIVAFISFVWMMVQRDLYIVGKCRLPSFQEKPKSCLVRSVLNKLLTYIADDSPKVGIEGSLWHPIEGQGFQPGPY